MLFADFENAGSQVAVYHAVRDFARKLLARFGGKRVAQYA